MQNLQALLDAVKEDTLGVRTGATMQRSLWILDFLSAVETPRSDAVYLLSEAELSGLAGGAKLPGAVFFVACAGDAVPELPPEIPDESTVVFVKDALLPLYGRLNRCMDMLRIHGRVDDIFLLAGYLRYNPEQLVIALSQMLSIGVFILDASYRRISGVAHEFGGSAYAQELEDTGMLSAGSVRAIRAGVEGAMLYESDSDKWARFNVLLLWRDSQRIDPRYLCRRLSDFVTAFRSRSTPPEVPPFLIDPRLNRILNGKTTDDAEIRSFFGADSASVWFSVLVLGSEPGVRWNAEAYQRQARLLSSAFRNVSVTVLHHQVCAVVRLPVCAPQENIYSRSFFTERAYNEGWDPERLERELQQCGVYLCCSATFQTPRFFPSEYEMLHDVLDIAIRLEGCRGRRIVEFYDYSPYYSIKLAVERFLQKFGAYALRSTLYPELVTLLMHDQKNGTDLAEVLYRYYIYGDVNRTAQALFVHRNTVYNKLKTIQNLLQVDLDDPAVRGSYLTSLQVYYYCEKCLGLDLHTLD